jgi:hypothetical protein
MVCSSRDCRGRALAQTWKFHKVEAQSKFGVSGRSRDTKRHVKDASAATGTAKAKMRGAARESPAPKKADVEMAAAACIWLQMRNRYT